MDAGAPGVRPPGALPGAGAPHGFPDVTSDPRSHRAYRRMVAALRAAWAEQGPQGRPCWCGQPIDYSLPADDPMAFTVEHVVPLSTDRDDHMNPTTKIPAHRRCNLGRGDGPMPLDIGQPSRKW